MSTEAVRDGLVAGKWPSDAYVWWKGQREWLAIRTWELQLDRLLQNEKTAAQPIWYIDVGAPEPMGPVTMSELLDVLRGAKNLAKTRLWTAGYASWISLFEVPDVMENLGLSRRESERAPLMGSAMIQRPTEGLAPITVATASISLGGMGLNGAHDMHKGDHCQIVIKSPDFPQTLHLNGETIYVTPNGYAGVKFDRVQPETHSLIHDYIRRFVETPSDETRSKKAA